jgi:hypothetical protein
MRIPLNTRFENLITKAALEQTHLNSDKGCDNKRAQKDNHMEKSADIHIRAFVNEQSRDLKSGVNSNRICPARKRLSHFSISFSNIYQFRPDLTPPLERGEGYRF